MELWTVVALGHAPVTDVLEGLGIRFLKSKNHLKHVV